MRTRRAFPVVAVLFAAFVFAVDAAAQTTSVKLVLEQSTDGLTNWQRVPLRAETLNGWDIDHTALSSKTFYRMKIVQASLTPSDPNMVTVLGGTFSSFSELAGQTVATFSIGKYEVTLDEWQSVRAWAWANGYSDLAGVGVGSAANHPVQSVSWYDAVKWCNAKSEKEGFTPVYQVGGVPYKTGQSLPTIVAGATGYRLPSELEWEWAARGGLSEHGGNYSGSNDLNAVGWYRDNSSGGTKPVGQKQPNELGLYDMSGNIQEWCFAANPQFQYLRGGGWSSVQSSCTITARGSATPDMRNGSHGFRLVRSSGN